MGACERRKGSRFSSPNCLFVCRPRDKKKDWVVVIMPSSQQVRQGEVPGETMKQGEGGLKGERWARKGCEKRMGRKC